MDWGLLVSHLWRMALAFGLALPTAWDRERTERTAGLRTFPLVALACCAYVRIALDVPMEEDSQARILQGLMTGIGFVGGGAILKSGDRVQGTATAASIWSMGALGAAAAYDRWEIAVLIAATNFAAFRWLTPVKSEVSGSDD